MTGANKRTFSHTIDWGEKADFLPCNRLGSAVGCRKEGRAGGVGQAVGPRAFGWEMPYDPEEAVM
eukprot:COSAG02_NODE_58637_length_276_cov_1.638418_1_plen_64_part_10